jgi:hypothetical protein
MDRGLIATEWGPTRPSVIDEDYPKPLYRDYSQQNGWSPPAPSRAAPRQESDPPTEETMSPIAFAPRRPRVKDDETTTILPRSRPTKHRTQALDAIDDYEDDEPTALGKRAKLALIVGAVAAVVVVGLVIGYSVLSLGKQPQSQPSVSAPGGWQRCVRWPGGRPSWRRCVERRFHAQRGPSQVAGPGSKVESRHHSARREAGWPDRRLLWRRTS